MAFDARKGRLWVICPRCDRWNLTPIEERYEVVEACEAHFRDARKRVSTDNVGLARVAPGLDLVRIGPALPPEFAAWRYGPTLRRRHLEMTALVGTSVVVAAAIGTAGVWQRLFGMGAVTPGAYGYSAVALAWHAWRRLARVDTGSGAFVDVRGHDLHRVLLFDRGGECALELPHAKNAVTLCGRDAVSAARAILPWMNRAGGSTRQVATAVELVEARVGAGGWPITVATGTPLSRLAPEHRLAIEMSSNEEIERRAMDGELGLLERAWRDAEDVAAIADNLLVPPIIDAWLRRDR